MKKCLPFLVSFLLIFCLFLSFRSSVFADTTTPGDGTWVNDPDVTFVGKVGARSGLFLDWTLGNYQWETLKPGSTDDPLASYWANIRNIVYAFLGVFVLITAFVLVVSRGRNITITRFIPRFILMVLLITFSFALIRFIYQITDIIQYFFLKNPDPAYTTSFISQKNLLNIGFNYQDFDGFRKFGAQFDESAFISLALIKLTAVTYYVMSGILLLRKIILWFFIIVSPVFPLLLLYAPIRNTAKIWVGEFFRWLLYAPLFAIFLSGLVQVWMKFIPLSFDFSQVGQDSAIVYPTAINILLGGPGQKLALGNSLNLTSTFAQYIVALLMLWVVIILPFLLLQIFLDYLNTISLSENNIIKQLLTGGSTLMNRAAPGSPPLPPTQPTSHQPAGMARTLPFTSKIEIPEIRAENITATNFRTSQTQLSQMTNLSIPTMRDIARYETSAMSREIGSHQEIAKYHETLERIANPNRIGAPIERQKYTDIKDKLVKEGQKGDVYANSVLTAADSISKTTSVLSLQKENAKINFALQQIATPNNAPLEQRQRLLTIKEELDKAQKIGDPLAASLTFAMQKGKAGADESLKQRLKDAKEKGNVLATAILQQAEKTDLKQFTASPFPVVNRVQSINVEDYEAVKKMWEENYKNMEPPKGLDTKEKGRKEWIQADIAKINETINFLVSTDPANVTKGTEAVGNILPFLLIGGFSQTEVIAYLKAKLEAAKAVLSQMAGKEEEEDTSLDRAETKVEKPKEMSAKEQVEEENKPSIKEENKLE